MRGLFAALVLALALGISAQAQTVTTVTNGTIAVTSTFQNVLSAQNGGRTGCTFQNQGTNTMYVFAGAIGSATIAKSLQITPGQIFMCGLIGSNSAANAVIQDAVNITGTAADAFVMNSQ